MREPYPLPHVFWKILGNGMAITMCGEPAWSVQCIDASTLPSLDGESVCLECRIALSKGASDNLDTPIVVVLNPLRLLPAAVA